MRLRLNIGILICILLMAQTAFALPEYAENGGMGAPTSMPSISPSASTGNIVILQELIEIDISHAEYITIRESIVFRVTGNYTTDLMTWVPDGAVDILVSRQSMMESVMPTEIPHIKEGNIVRFNDSEQLSSIGMSMYAVQYAIPRSAEDEALEYKKVLQYPTYINYPISSLIIKVIHPEEIELIIKDEGGNVIQGDGIETNVNEVVHTWSAPQFKEITIETKATSNITGILPYIVIGLIVLAILAFPFVQKKMKREDDEVFVESASTFEEEGEEDSDSEEYEDELDVEEEEKEKTTMEEPDLDELENRYDAVLSLLNEMKEDRDNGDISDDEYETLSKKYKMEAIDLMKTIDKLQDELGQ